MIFSVSISSENFLYPNIAARFCMSFVLLVSLWWYIVVVMPGKVMSSFNMSLSLSVKEWPIMYR